MDRQDVKVTKRDGSVEPFNGDKVLNSIKKAYASVKKEFRLTDDELSIVRPEYWDDNVSVEDIQNAVERLLFDLAPYDVAKSYLLYREKHKESRFIRDRLDYMKRYTNSGATAAATLSESDPNANVSQKNVANLESEVYKENNRVIQRQRMKDRLNKMYPEVAKKYITDLDNHIIYCHDEASSPALKFYCQAVSLYPLMLDGAGNIDGVTPGPPNDLQSFSGQITNLTFLLSSQCKGAVAFGGYFIALNYYIVKEFGDRWYNRLDEVVSTEICVKKKTVRDCIYKAFKQFIYGINQPAGNRAYQSPFTNISYYDRLYFVAMFKDFRYPDGSRPEWVAISSLQKMFMKFFNKLRTVQIVTFPVETVCLIYDSRTRQYQDHEWRDFVAEMYAEGHSFFTYISDSVDSLSSCCRLRSELKDNTFNPTAGLTGLKTGSCNVISLNMNRITQDCFRMREECKEMVWTDGRPVITEDDALNFTKNWLVPYLRNILERVYKYHIAFKTMLYEMEEKGMFAACNGGYISMSDLYSTIGINGLNEAAEFLGLNVSNNSAYIEFLKVVLGTIKEENRINSVRDAKRPFLFNSECVPAESLSWKNYKWDSEDDYWVPKDRNLYNSYFYNAHDDTSVLDKMALHGEDVTKFCDGGSACHINLENHLSKTQYLKLLDVAAEKGTNYFTFNIPNSKCLTCNYIVKHPVMRCPKCNSSNIDYYTRIIGYLRPIRLYGTHRETEAKRRTYNTFNEVC